MKVEAILGEDPKAREEAIAAAASAPEHERSALASKLGPLARDAAAALAAGEADSEGNTARLGRACTGLSVLRVEAAKNCLLRIADEGTPAVKSTLARALRATKTSEGRAVLVHLLSDDDARKDAIIAIGAAPWPGVLQALIEVAEADDHAARIAAIPIAKCGASGSPNEASAAADFLLEQLDDDVALPTAAVALLRFGRGFPAIAKVAKRIAKGPGNRKVACLCLVAAYGDEGNANFLELALAGTKVDGDAARAFLEPLMKDADERIRAAAERTWKALDLK
ncbi:MAG TPA: hypothetical protein VM925_17175 [Labilithrix sp.]|nr:hypothetical protein [Labilithrix sp.]